MPKPNIIMLKIPAYLLSNLCVCFEVKNNSVFRVVILHTLKAITENHDARTSD